jgi:hypothetical protein
VENVTTSSSILRDENAHSIAVFDRIEAQFRNQSILLAKEREDIETSNNATKELINISNKRSKKLEKKLDKYFADSEQRKSNSENNIGISQQPLPMTQPFINIQPPTSTVPINMYTPHHQRNITSNLQQPQFQQQYPITGVPPQPVHADFNNQQLPYYYNLTTNNITNVPLPQTANQNMMAGNYNPNQAMLPYNNQLSNNSVPIPYQQSFVSPNPATFIMAPPVQTTAQYHNNIPQQYYQHPQQSPLMFAVNPQQQQMMAQQQPVASQQYSHPVSIAGITYYPYNNQQQHH